MRNSEASRIIVRLAYSKIRITLLLSSSNVLTIIRLERPSLKLISTMTESKNEHEDLVMVERLDTDTSFTGNNSSSNDEDGDESSHPRGDENKPNVSDSQASNSGNEDVMGSKRQVGGAAVAGGIAGLVLGGPMLGLIGAGGAAAIATSQSNKKPAQFVRKTGDAMADAGDRLQQFDRKHRVVEKTSNSINKGCSWVSKKINFSIKEPGGTRRAPKQL